jgi:hypothetical protein
MAGERNLNRPGLIRAWSSLILVGVNCALFGAFLIMLIFRPVALTAPWDGPAVATVALSAATIVLAAVGIGVGLLAVWGYTTLREHAGNIANEAAAKAADARVQILLKEWGFSEGAEDTGEAIAKAYEKE